MGLLVRVFRLVWGSEVDRALRPVLAVQLAGSLAGGCVAPFLGIWAIKHLDAGQPAVGVVYLIGAVVAAGSGYFGGHLSDHWGRRRLILAGWVLSAFMPLAALAVGARELPGLVVLAILPSLGAIGGSADTAMVADLVPPARHEAAYAAVRVASNFGVTLGPVIGGLLLALAGWNALFIGVTVLAANAVLLAWRYVPRGGAYAPEAPPEKGRARAILRDRPFLVYVAAGTLASFVYVAYETVLPISLVVSHGLSNATWGFLVCVNPAIVTVFQLRLTRATERWSPALKLGIALPLMGLPFLLLSVTAAIPAVVLVIVIFVVGEMLWIPTSQSVVARLAPDDLRGAYMGAFGISWSVSWALGPFLGLQVHAAAGDLATWTMFAAMSLVAGSVGAVAATGATRSRRASLAAA
ncbi:MAG TPA: MFS transporter [Gaiellaceae bacterium]|nr:MFS transporter [Gaiellaceae bacterium]